MRGWPSTSIVDESRVARFKQRLSAASQAGRKTKRPADDRALCAPAQTCDRFSPWWDRACPTGDPAASSGPIVSSRCRQSCRHRKCCATPRKRLPPPRDNVELAVKSLRSRASLADVVALMSGVARSVLTPPWQAPDEIHHFEYVQYLAETGHPPGMTRTVDSAPETKLWGAQTRSPSRSHARFIEHMAASSVRAW
jgi:hypothetical protein